MVFVALAQPSSSATVTATFIAGSATAVTATPAPAPTNTSKVTVHITGAKDKTGAVVNGATYMGVSMCGNFAKDGITALSTINDASTQCDGGADISHIVFANFTNGDSTFDYTLRATGIGSADIQCLSGGLIPCTIKMGDVANLGQNFAVSIPIFGGTSSATTTTTLGTSTTSSSTTSTVVPASSSAPPPAASVNASTRTTTVPAGEPQLALTGSSSKSLPFAVVGIALLDIGWLAVSATRPGGRRRLFAGQRFGR
jgi:hypothetical protein